MNRSLEYSVRTVKAMRFSKAVLWLLVLAVYSNTKPVSAYNHTERLYNDVIKAYDYRFRPVINDSQPVTVYVSFHLLTLLGIFEVSQKFDVNAWMNITWTDELRRWDPSKYGGIDIFHPDHKNTWLPRPIHSNAEHRRDVFADDYHPTAIFANGVTRYYPGSIFSSSCSLDLTHFPFDEQSCFLEFYANEYAKSILLLPDPSSPDVGKGNYIENEEWNFVDSEVIADQPLVGDSIFSRIQFRMRFQRRPNFYVFTVLLPIVLMSILSSLVFVLPEESGERASFSITVVLTLAMFLGLVSTQLPQNSDSLPVIVSYLFALLIQNILCVVFNVVQLRWLHFISHKSVTTEEASCAVSQHNMKRAFPLSHQHAFNKVLTGTENDDNVRSNTGYISQTVATARHDDKSNFVSGDNQAFCDRRENRITNSTGNEKRDATELYRDRGFCGRHLAGASEWLKDANVLLFLFSNSVWTAVSIYYIYRLFNHA